MATNAETIVSITRDATRNFGILYFLLLLLLFFSSNDGRDDSVVFRRPDDDVVVVELISDEDDDNFLEIVAEVVVVVNAGYAAIAIANIALRNVLPANHVCGIKYLRNRNSSIKV